MAGEEEELVANPYRAAIQSRRRDAAAITPSVDTELRAMRTAMDNGAWQSGTADTFYAELAGHITAVDGSADDVLEEFDDAIRQQPVEVEHDAWQTRWRNL